MCACFDDMRGAGGIALARVVRPSLAGRLRRRLVLPPLCPSQPPYRTAMTIISFRSPHGCTPGSRRPPGGGAPPIIMI